MSYVLAKLVFCYIIFSWLFMGCAREDKAPFLVEIAGTLSSGQYGLQVVEISRPPKLIAQEARNFIYLSDIKIYQELLAHTALTSRSFATMRARLQQNLGGSPLDPIY